MRLTFVGAGGVGGYFGGLVAARGGEVTLVARGDHGRALREQGLTVRTDAGDIHVRPQVVLPGEPMPPIGAAVLAVKHRDLDAALERIAPALQAGAPVLSLLNGLGHERDVRRVLPGAHPLLGMAFVGAHVEGPGVVRHTSEGRMSFGELDGAPGPSAEALRDALAVGDFPVHLVDDVRAAVWRKVLWNAAFNTANALVGGTCRDLMESPATVAHMRAVMEEVQAAAAADGVTLENRWIDGSLEAEVNFTPYRTSMALDLEAGRALELEPILHRVIEMARAHDVAVPRIEALAALLDAADRRARGEST